MQHETHEGRKDKDRAAFPHGASGLSAPDGTASLAISLEQEETHEGGGSSTLREPIAPA